MTESLHELLKFIQIGARFDLKAIALEHILGLTATEDGISKILEIPEISVSLICLLNDHNEIIMKHASIALINLSAHNKGAEHLINLDFQRIQIPLQKLPKNLIETILNEIFNVNSKIADSCCIILSNLTRQNHLVEKIIEFLDNSDKNFYELINIFTKKQYNKHGATLDYLGPCLENLSQNPLIRKLILDTDHCVIQRLLPFTTYQESIIRRNGIVGTIKNCCFDCDQHEWLLSDEIDILPRLLLPLAGNEEFDDEDNDKLPLDLQYLPDDKCREPEADIRSNLLEAITQLCTRRQNREYIRDKNTYIILRELHKSEQDRKVLLACENLVDLLIRTEDEIGEDNLKDLEIPKDLQETFKTIDNEFLNNP